MRMGEKSMYTVGIWILGNVSKLKTVTVVWHVEGRVFGLVDVPSTPTPSTSQEDRVRNRPVQRVIG